MNPSTTPTGSARQQHQDLLVQMNLHRQRHHQVLAQLFHARQQAQAALQPTTSGSTP